MTPIPCQESHYYHTECIEHWLTQKTECPLCRTPVDL
ncbi:MAG: RING finger domain-containing protein [bacterium]